MPLTVLVMEMYLYLLTSRLHSNVDSYLLNPAALHHIKEKEYLALALA